MSFENFPYTNFHELNLDWIIQRVKEAYSPENPPENVVFTVNGETGDVTLYKDAIVRFPDVEENSWNIHRVADNSSSGIQFRKDNPAQRINGTSRFNIYDEGNPPPYPVTSVGALTGAVAILDTTIVTDSGTQKLKITFPVTSVDGQTGTVSTWAYTNNDTLKTPVASSEANVWQLIREIPSGDAGIRFEYDSTDDEISGYLVFDDGVNTPLKVKILTPADIPSSSGVVSINGKAGVVTLTGEDIEVSNQDSTKIDAALSALGTEDTNIKGSLAYNEDGNTATQNIPVGSFVVWKGHAYTASAAISSGDTLSISTNLTAISNGIANELNSKLTRKDVSIQISIPANTLSTGDIDISSNPGEHLFVVGFEIAGTPDVVPMQIYLSNKNNIHYRLRNIANAEQNTVALKIFYC